MAGFYTVNHGDQDHPVFGINRRPFTRWEAYCWLLDHAAFGTLDTTFRGQLVTLTRGQIAASLGSLAGDWHWPRAAVQRFLKSLKSAGFISSSKHLSIAPPNDTGTDTPPDTAITIITICSCSGISLQKSGTDTPPDTGTDTLSETTPYMLDSKKEDKKERKSTQPSAEWDRQPDLLGGGRIVTLPVDDVRSAFEAFQLVARDLKLSVPITLTSSRRPKLRQRLKELDGLAGWTAALETLRGAQWITSGRWKGFCIDDMLNPGKLTNLLEGRYNNVWEGGTHEHPVLQEAREYREQHLGDSFFNEISPTGTYKP